MEKEAFTLQRSSQCWWQWGFSKGKSPPSLLLGKASSWGRSNDFLGKTRQVNTEVYNPGSSSQFLMNSFYHSFMSWFLKEMFKFQSESGACEAESSYGGMKWEVPESRLSTRRASR